MREDTYPFYRPILKRHFNTAYDYLLYGEAIVKPVKFYAGSRRVADSFYIRETNVFNNIGTLLSSINDPTNTTNRMQIDLANFLQHVEGLSFRDIIYLVLDRQPPQNWGIEKFAYMIVKHLIIDSRSYLEESFNSQNAKEALFVFNFPEWKKLFISNLLGLESEKEKITFINDIKNELILFSRRAEKIHWVKYVEDEPVSGEVDLGKHISFIESINKKPLKVKLNYSQLERGIDWLSCLELQNGNRLIEIDNLRGLILSEFDFLDKDRFEPGDLNYSISINQKIPNIAQILLSYLRYFYDTTDIKSKPTKTELTNWLTWIFLGQQKFSSGNIDDHLRKIKCQDIHIQKLYFKGKKLNLPISPDQAENYKCY